MSDEQTIYISPDDDLTTVRERLEKIPSDKITLVIPTQTQLRSHVAWKLLYARTRELNKEVIIVSSDPQVRSVAHAVKFRVAHSLESTPHSGRSRSGSRPVPARSNAGSSRHRSTTSPSATTAAKEPASKRGGSRPSRNTRAPSVGQTTTPWSQHSPLTPSKPLGAPPSHFDAPGTAEPHEPRPRQLNLPERNERREEQSSHRSQLYDFRAEGLPAIHPLPINQIEEPDLLIEDYNQAQHIREAATGNYPIVQKPEAAGPASSSSDTVDMHTPGTGASLTPTDKLPSGTGAGPAPTDQLPSGTEISPAPTNQPVDMHMPETGTSPAPTNQSHRPVSQVYGEADPFLYMEDDSQPPSQAEQKGEAVLQDDEISQEYPLLQKPARSDLPINATKSEIEYTGDEDDFVPPSSSTSTTRRARPQDIPFEDEKAEERPSQLSPHPYEVPPWDNRSDTLPSLRQTFNDEEDQLSALPEPSMPMQGPQAIALPMPRAQSKPLAPISKPLPQRAGGKVQQQAPVQQPSTGPTMRNGSGVPQARGNRPTSQPTQQYRGPSGPRSAVGTGTGRPATRGRVGRPRRLYLILASIAAILVILFGALYLNVTSTIQITVTTQVYTHAVTLTLSDQKQQGSVPAKSMTQDFTKTLSGTATGSTMQGVNKATGTVFFTNTGTASVQIPSQTVLATRNNVNFVTTANALILPPNTGLTPVPVPIQASEQGALGNVAVGSITVIPAESLANIAQAQPSPVTAESLKTTLTVSNPERTTGGEAHQVPAVTQPDLDKAKNELNTLVQGDIDAWKQTLTKNGLVGQPVISDTHFDAPDTDTAAPNKTFSATIRVKASVLLAQLDDVQRVTLSQLNKTVQADQQWGPAFAIIGDDPREIKIDLAQQSAGNGNTVTAPATGNAGPNLNKTDLQNSTKGKSPSEAQAIVRKSNQDIQTVDIQTQPGIFSWEVSPWADHINVIVLPAAAKK